MRDTREAAVAGMFYPDDPAQLRREVEAMLADARTDAPAPKAMIAPHAGYVYSGPIAASAYARLRNRVAPITRVVLAGPAHRVGFRGIATHTARAFETPLGEVSLDRAAVADVEALPFVFPYDQAHAREHSLEVHLPFLQVTLGAFSLVPLCVGVVEPAAVATALERLWGGTETLVVISSDLTHYLDYQTARRIDAETSRAIEALAGAAIGHEQACGRLPIQGLLEVARARGLRAQTVDLRSSGDTAGPRDRVVGYGAYVLA
ncbi:MAG: AmmeMemoRadiSam system protein B [Nannocystaceae bacterium]